MKKFAFFKGCKIPYYLNHYALSTQAVLNVLDIALIDIEFNCCGYPMRNFDFSAYLLSAARNLAIAERKGLDILTPCKCCFGSLKHAEHYLKETPQVRNEINTLLIEEGLQWKGGIQIKHLLTVLKEDVGVNTITDRIKRPFNGVKIAAHYGCHALRPGRIMQFDDPMAPTLFETLVDITGAQSVDWDMRLQCCGNPLRGKNDSLSLDLMNKKIESARAAGADYLCSACTYCQYQFDTIQQDEAARNQAGPSLPSILYTQLLGLSLGISDKELGISMNRLDVEAISNYLLPIRK